MKKIYFIMIIAAFLIQVNACAKSSGGDGATQKGSSIEVTWYGFNEGMKLALAKQKPVVIDFFADWCVWCKKMDTEVFSDPGVAQRLKDEFICIRIYTDKDLDETIRYKKHVLSKPEFSSMVGVQGLPTVVFMDKNADLVTKIPGYIKKDVFLPLLGYISEECYEKKISFNDYKLGKISCAKKK